MAARLPVLFEDIAIAATRIRGGVVRSPVTHSYWLSQLCGCDVFLKHEQFQFTGSFKERGARNALMSLSEEKKAKGVVAASAGNHALALSWHGKQLGIPVSVLMPTVGSISEEIEVRQVRRQHRRPRRQHRRGQEVRGGDGALLRDDLHQRL